MSPWHSAIDPEIDPPLLTVDKLTGGMSHGDLRSISRPIVIPR